MQRRQFLGFLSLGALAALTGGASAEHVGLDADEFTASPTWTGTADARPAGDSHHLTGLEGRIIYIATDTGAVSYIDEPDGQWTELAAHFKSVSEADLPPPGAAEGSAYWNADRKVPTFYDGEDMEYPTIGDDVLTSTQVVENDSTEVTVWDGNLDAGSMKVGRVYRVNLLGNYSTNDGTDTFHLRFYIDGTQVADVQSVAANVDPAPISARLTVTVRGIDVSGEVQPHVEAIFDDEHMDVHHDTESVDTTVANTLKATVQWDVAEAGDRVEIGQGYMEEIN